jgi:hypothetical protein
MALPKDAPVKDIIRATIVDLETNGRQKGRNQTIGESSRNLPGAIAHSVGHLVTMHNMSAQARETVKRVSEFLGIYDLETYNNDHTDDEVLRMLRKAVGE